MSDEALFASSDTNPDAFAVLVGRHRRKMLRIAFCICGSREISEEVVQEALLCIFVYRKRFEHRPGSVFRKWANRVLINTALNAFRKQNKEKCKRVAINNLDTLISSARVEAEIETDGAFCRRNRARIESALGKLSKPYAEILRLHYLERRSYLELTRELGVPISTVKTRLFHARVEFRRLFNNNPRLFFGE